MVKCGDYMFIGEYYHNLDTKGRLMFPVKLRNQLGDSFVVTRGIDKCLYVYPISAWEKLANKINDLPLNKKSTREFSRMILSGAQEVSPDSQGRINISNPLLSYAGLDKECVILGVGEKMEIWDKELWTSHFDKYKEEFSDIVENMEFDI